MHSDAALVTTCYNLVTTCLTSAGSHPFLSSCPGQLRVSGDALDLQGSKQCSEMRESHDFEKSAGKRAPPQVGNEFCALRQGVGAIAEDS